MPKGVVRSENSNYSYYTQKPLKPQEQKKTPHALLEQATDALAARLQKYPTDAPVAEYKQFKKAFRTYQDSEERSLLFSDSTLGKLKNAYASCFKTLPPGNDVFFKQYARVLYEQSLLQPVLPASLLSAETGRIKSSSLAEQLRFVKMLCAEYSPEIIKDEEAGASVRFGISCFYNYFAELKTTDILPSNSEHFALIEEFIIATRLQLKHCVKLQCKIETMQVDSNKKLARHIEPTLEKYFLKNENPIMPFGWYFKNVVGHVMYGVFTDRNTVRMSDVRGVENESAANNKPPFRIPSSTTYRFNENTQPSYSDKLSVAMLLQDPRLCEEIASQVIASEKKQACEEEMKMTAEAILLGVMSKELHTPHESKNPLDTYEMQTENICATCFTPLLYELALQFLVKIKRATLADMQSFRVFMDAINLNYKQQQMKFTLGIINNLNSKLSSQLKKNLKPLVKALVHEWSKLDKIMTEYSMNEIDYNYLTKKLDKFNRVVN